MIILTILLIVISYLVVTFWRYVEKRQILATWKADPSLPLLGHALILGTNPHEIYKQLFRMWRQYDHGPFRFETGPWVAIVISSPEYVEAILSTTQFLEKHTAYDLLLPWLGTGLITSSGAKWHGRRKILTPAFHFKILEQFTDVFQNQAEILVRKLASLPDGDDVDVHPLVSLFSLSAINETAMGIQTNAQETESSYTKAIEEVCRISQNRMYSFLQYSDFLFKFTDDGRTFYKCVDIIHKQTYEVIERRRSELREKIEAVKSGAFTLEAISQDETFGAKQRLAFLDLLLLSKTADGQPLCDEDIREEVTTFTFAGHDTTSSALSFTLLCLARNPEVQRKAFQEQLELTSGDLERPVTFRDAQDMKYLERVVKESLRIYPPVPIFGRKVTSDFVFPDGMKVPAGTQVAVMPCMMHLDPILYPEPDRFDPDRFTTERMAGAHPYAYVPFSAGPRNCIGQKFAMLEMKCVLANVIRSLEILPSPGFEPELSSEITLKSVNGVMVRFRKRI